MNDRNSYRDCERWNSLIEEYGEPHTNVLLVGNQTNTDGSREVEYDEAYGYAQQREFTYVETTPHDFTALFEGFKSLINSILLLFKEQENESISAPPGRYSLHSENKGSKDSVILQKSLHGSFRKTETKKSRKNNSFC